MQIKTIKRNIKNKMNEWLDTITDVKLRNDVENTLLVSGGCITSMLLQEDVNDYDVYLTDINVLKRLAEYYSTDNRTIKVLCGIDKDKLLADFNMDNLEDVVCDQVIQIQNLNTDQVKLYMPSNPSGLRVNETVAESDLNYTPLFYSPNAISLSNKLQIVLRFSGSAEEIHKNYDFLHATNYYTTKDGLVLNQKALESIITKQLKYQGSKYPVTSILRVHKFLRRNWRINAGEMFKIIFQVSELDLQDLRTLEEQLVGVDVAYFSTLIDVLKDSKAVREGSRISATYMNTIIDKVFNESIDEV